MANQDSRTEKKPILLVDMDDTIEDLLSPWLEWLNKKYGYCVTWDDIDAWDMQKFYPTLTQKQIYAPFRRKRFWKKVKVRTDAFVYLKRLFNEGFDIYICTSTDYRNVRVKYEKIIKPYFPYIKWNHMIITSKKQMIRADFLVDDGVHNLVDGEYKKILFTAPHNRNYDAAGNGMYRVNNWKEAYNIIKTFLPR